jgi:ribosome biogenesis GTPase
MTRAARAAAGFEARVVADFGRHHLVRDAGGSLRQATRRGKRDDVVVGDRVCCTPTGADAVIESIGPRASLLYRSDDLRSKSLAANIDQLAVVFAAEPPFNPGFIWRALVAAQVAGIGSLVILNKTDLPEGASTARASAERERLACLGYPTHAVSAKSDRQRAQALLRPALAGRNTLLVGQSGMGKSTLLNLLVPDAAARTQEYSARLNLGRQTTTATRWFDLPEGGAVVDTPGFQNFGLAHVAPTELAAALPEFAPRRGRCRFADCRHLQEPGCAIRTAVEAGAIDVQRYAFYRELVGGRRPR